PPHPPHKQTNAAPTLTESRLVGGEMADGRPRVVVTGMGVIAPLGIGLDEFWKNAAEGRSGVGRMTLADPTDYPCQVAGECLDFDYTLYLDRKDGRRMARFRQMAVAASKMALDHAGVELDALSEADRERFGVVMGNGGGGLPNDLEAVRTMDERGGMKVDPF